LVGLLISQAINETSMHLDKSIWHLVFYKMMNPKRNGRADGHINGGQRHRDDKSPGILVSLFVSHLLDIFWTHISTTR
jgi:hypothetical protein